MRLIIEIKPMLTVIVLACMLVLGAMMIDLASGLYKAKQRGEIRSSWGLKRTLTKFITYEGSMLIAGAVDVLIHYCKLLQLFHLDIIYGVPIVTCLLAIFLLIVEGLSVREAADEKTKTEMTRVAELASHMVKKEDLIDAITQAIINTQSNRHRKPHKHIEEDESID